PPDGEWNRPMVTPGDGRSKKNFGKPSVCGLTGRTPSLGSTPAVPRGRHPTRSDFACGPPRGRGYWRAGATAGDRCPYLGVQTHGILRITLLGRWFAAPIHRGGPGAARPPGEEGGLDPEAPGTGVRRYGAALCAVVRGADCGAGPGPEDPGYQVT